MLTQLQTWHDNKYYRHKSNATSEVNWFSQAGMGQAGNVNPTTDMTWQQILQT